jgi:molybdate transport system regulatory protein
VIEPCEPRARTDGEPRDDALGSGLRCRTKVWLERRGELALSEWRLSLLLAVDETGSLTQAAEQMDVPYRTAWYKLKAIERALGMKLLATQSGGTEGGHSELTPEARDLLARFRRVTRGVDEYVEARFRAEFGDLLD